jgi:hypothetical protein
MVSRVITRMEDDIDGSEAAETILIGLDGATWEIDLSEQNAKKLRDDLSAYVNKARKVGGRSRRNAGSSKSLIDNKAVRVWAQANGIELSKRGRIPADVIERYKADGN